MMLAAGHGITGTGRTLSGGRGRGRGGALPKRESKLRFTVSFPIRRRCSGSWTGWKRSAFPCWKYIVSIRGSRQVALTSSCYGLRVTALPLLRPFCTTDLVACRRRHRPQSTSFCACCGSCRPDRTAWPAGLAAGPASAIVSQEIGRARTSISIRPGIRPTRMSRCPSELCYLVLVNHDT